jgi:L-seryl-tRNA(Ser) seleniumtransferase
MRAMRPDKLTLAALEATLESYREECAERELPALRMLAATADQLAARKDQLLLGLRVAAPALSLEALRVRSAVGGGALPLAEPESWGVAVRHPTLGADALLQRLTDGAVPLVARVQDGNVVLDVRTLDDADVPEAIAQVAATAIVEGASS